MQKNSSFIGAIQSCGDYSSSLVKIETSEENDFVHKICGRHNCWLGLQEEERSGKWFWLDGSELKYENWQKGEPDNMNGTLNETAAMMNLVDYSPIDYVDGYWYDVLPSLCDSWIQGIHGYCLTVFPLCEKHKEETGNLDFTIRLAIIFYL